MKSQTQIEEKNNTTKSQREPERFNVRVTRETEDALYSLAAKLDCEPCQIVEGAIRSYIAFADDHNLAWNQSRFKNCDQELHNAISAELSNTLYLFEQTSGMDQEQIAEIAVKTYIDFADVELCRTEMRKWLAEKPGSIAPEQIEYMRRRRTSHRRILLIERTSANEDT